ncbi:MAG: hypothetical protein IT462_05950, partial [Planctomycetes bacterium]|nr:hypothetical protein [Planctomycetota bacterium]
KGNNAGALARTLPDMFGLYPRSIFGMPRQELAEAGVSPEEAIDALRALIAVGGEDQSIDFVFALGLALGADGRMDDSCLALWRATELAEAGLAAWTLPATRASALKAVIKASAPPIFGDDQSRHATELQKLATEGRAWNGARNTYLITAMRDGRHPDTEPDFWKDYDTPRVIAQTQPHTGFGSGVLAPAAAIVLLVIAALGFAIYFMIKRHKAIPTVKDL